MTEYTTEELITKIARAERFAAEMDAAKPKSFAASMAITDYNRSVAWIRMLSKAADIELLDQLATMTTNPAVLHTITNARNVAGL
ncbi:MAG: hypothetical protein QM628_00165 [Propionicimonas sp.]